MRNNTAEYRAANGLCVQCGSTGLLPGFTRCEKCKEYNRIKYRQKYNNRKIQKVCVKCGNSLDREGSICSKCCQKSALQAVLDRKFYQNIKICPYCKKTKLWGDERVCLECQAKAYIKNQRRYKNAKNSRN